MIRRLVPFRSPHRFAIIGVLLVAVIAVVDILVIRMERAAVVRAFQSALMNLDRGMARETSELLGAADRTLRYVQRRAAGATATADTVRADLHSRATHDVLVDQQKRLPYIEALLIVDASGRIANGSRGQASVGRDMSTSDFFAHFSQQADLSVFVGAPVKDPSSGAWRTYLARRLSDARGQFVGVALAELSVAGLEDYYRMAMPLRRRLTVLRRDGTVIMKFPHPETRVGMNAGSPAWYALVAAGGGAFYGTGRVDHNLTIVSHLAVLPNLPLVVEASMREPEVLADWYAQRVWTVLGGVVASLIAMALLRLFGAQVDRLELSEMVLAAKNHQVEATHRQLQLALSNIPVGLSFFDGNQRLVLCNGRYGAMYGLPPAVMQPGVPLAEIVDQSVASVGLVERFRSEVVESREMLVRAGKPQRQIVALGNGRTIAVQMQPMPDGGWISTHEDISDRRAAEQKIAFLASHDVLTGLANRSLLHERIAEALATVARGHHFAVLFLDLDRFKAVNDTLGHSVGDKLLRVVAERLLSTVREGDTVARLGGDEFVILQASARAPGDAAYLAERLIRAVGAPFNIDGHDVSVGVSVGIEMTGPQPSSADDLMKRADMALYIAKAEGRGTFRFFEPEMDVTLQNRHALERDLREAVAEQQFVLHYQPVVNAGSGLVCGFEALLRWQHPLHGLVAPDAFIPVAEDTNLILPIGQWVVAQACRDAATWPDHLRVAVNVSSAQFRGGDLFEVISAALAGSGLSAGRLEVEITESVLLRNDGQNMAILHRLRDAGIGIAMDDFGIGYSSLSFLRRFPFDRVKIDRSFIRDLSTRPDDIFVVRAVVGLCRNLGISTTAEGVETTDQHAILLAEGCTQLQGYLFSRAMDGAHVADFLSAQADSGVATPARVPALDAVGT